jgi:hypothetical protein
MQWRSQGKNSDGPLRKTIIYNFDKKIILHIKFLVVINTKLIYNTSQSKAQEMPRTYYY